MSYLSSSIEPPLLLKFLDLLQGQFVVDPYTVRWLQAVLYQDSL